MHNMKFQNKSMLGHLATWVSKKARTLTWEFAVCLCKHVLFLCNSCGTMEGNTLPLIWCIYLCIYFLCWLSPMHRILINPRTRGILLWKRVILSQRAKNTARSNMKRKIYCCLKILYFIFYCFVISHKACMIIYLK